MAISATKGGTINNATAGLTLTFTSANFATGQYLVVAVAILNTSVSVSSITDTALNAYTFQSSINSGSSVRVELWAASSIIGNASDVILVTLSGNSLASAAYEEYAGPTAIGNIGTAATGTGYFAEGDVATQDTGSYSVSAIAVASSSGDTFTTSLGTIRQSLVPALTTASVALVDNTSLLAVTMRDSLQLSTSRAWAAASLELRTGVAATVVDASKVITPITNAGKGAFHQKVLAPNLGTLPSSTSGSASA